MTSEPLTPEMEKDIRDWLTLQDSLYAEGGVWHGRKREDHHIRAAAMVAEIDCLRAAIEELIAYGVPPHVEQGLRAALEGKP